MILRSRLLPHIRRIHCIRMRRRTKTLRVALFVSARLFQSISACLVSFPDCQTVVRESGVWIWSTVVAPGDRRGKGRKVCFQGDRTLAEPLVEGKMALGLWRCPVGSSYASRELCLATSGASVVSSAWSRSTFPFGPRMTGQAHW